MSRPSSEIFSGPQGGIHAVDPEAIDDVVQSLSSLVLEDVGERASGTGQRHVDDESVVLVIPSEIVDEAEVDDVDPELGIHHVFEGLGDRVVLRP